MRRIYMVMAAGLVLTGTALFSGCSNNELLENGNQGVEVPVQPAENFSFSLKGMKAGTRATADELTKDEEKAVKTMYVAFFVNNGSADEKGYPLHRIFAYDDKITFDDNAENPWKLNTQITESTGSFTIEKPGTVGDYVVYFIANPDADMKATFAKFQLSSSSGAEMATRATLKDLEALKIKTGTADGTTDGFVMLAKQNITLGDPATSEITLTRLAARFDFINSAATAAANSKVEITGITIKNSAQASRLMELADPSSEDIKEQVVDISDWEPTDPATYKTAYIYENLNISGENTAKRLSIKIDYKLKAGDDVEATEMTKTIELKEGDVDLAVQRNHIYRIFMNGVTGEFSLEVQDWNEGATVTVPDGDLAVNYTATDLGKVGDYVYNNNGKLDFSDGGLRKMYLSGTLEWTNMRPAPAKDKGTCIGIVFSNMTSKKDQLAGYKKGYVMGLKNANNAAWGIEGDAGLSKVSTLGEFIKDLDGYSNCQIIKSKANYQTDYPAFYNAMNYGVVLPTDVPTSGWYLPSIGQLSAIFYNFTEMSTLRNSSNNTKDLIYKSHYEIFKVEEHLVKLNEKISQLKESEYDLFEGGMNYLTSSEVPANTTDQDGYRAYIYIGGKVAGYADRLVLAGWGKKGLEASKGQIARPVFAF